MSENNANTTTAPAPAEDPKEPQQNGTETAAEPSSSTDEFPVPEGGVKLFVGNLDYAHTIDELETSFKPFGCIHARLVTIRSGKRSGQSRGYGFVILKDKSKVEDALKLHQQEFHGRRINVQYAREDRSPTRRPPSKNRRPRRVKGRRPPRRGSRRPRSQRQSQTPPEYSTDTVHVSNLDFNVTEDMLKQLFKDLNIVKAVIARYRNSPKSRGYGFVQFASEEDQNKAIDQANETQFEGRKIRVKAAHKRETLADSSEAASSSTKASTSTSTEAKAETPAESTNETK